MFLSAVASVAGIFVIQSRGQFELVQNYDVQKKIAFVVYLQVMRESL